MAKSKPKKKAPPPAPPALPEPTVVELPDIEIAVDRIKTCGYDVGRCGTDMYRVNLPDPVDGFNLRSYFDSTRLREISTLERAQIKEAIDSAPVQSRPVFVGRWPRMSVNSSYIEDEITTNEGDEMLKKTSGPLPKPSQKKTTKGRVKAQNVATNGTAGKGGKKTARAGLSDAQIKQFIKDAKKAGVPLKTSAVEKFIREKGHSISHVRVKANL